MSAAKPLLWLINPIQDIKQPASNIGMNRLLGKKTGMTPGSLPLLAALTPDRYRVRIIDEELEPIPGPGEPQPDLVGLTMISTNCRRGFEIGDLFRQRKAPVVAGGPYVSFNVEEALEHVDCVVKGEAEGTWPRVLADLEKGALQQTYQPDQPYEFKRSAIPRWDLLDTSQMAALPVQVSRGCPYRCEFCLVPELFGKGMRYREIDDVIREIESLPVKMVFFVDDNLTANKPYAHELMRRLKPLGILWFCMASLELAEHPDLLKEMAEAGCLHVLIGFESVNAESLREAQKRQNRVERFGQAIEKFHQAGIEVNASFVVGFDHDTLEQYDSIHRFLVENDLWYANLNVLDVIPGTQLHRRVLAEGRWYGRPSDFSGGMFPVMHYAKVGQFELFDANMAAIEHYYSFEDLEERAVRHFGNGNFAHENPNPEIGLLGKVWLSLKLAAIYLLSGNPVKRRLFLRLFRLMREKKVAPGKLVFFLFTVEGVHRQLALLKQRFPEWRATIRSFDKGPWTGPLGPAPRPGHGAHPLPEQRAEAP